MRLVVAYLFLDQSSARHPAFTARLDDPRSRIIVPDVYFAEFSRAAPATLERHLERLRECRDRLYCAVSSSECLFRERDDRRRTTRGFVISSQATVLLRKRLADVRSLADLMTQPEVVHTVVADRYSKPDNRDAFKGMVREYERAMKMVKYRAPAGTPMNEEELQGTIKLGRGAVSSYLQHRGWSPAAARAFAKKDSFMFRDICVRMCRFADWAQAKGIDGQDSAKIDNEGMDIEYVALASYFDEFLTDDKRNQRNDANFRRLLALAPTMKEMREPEEDQVRAAAGAKT